MTHSANSDASPRPPRRLRIVFIAGSTLLVAGALLPALSSYEPVSAPDSGRVCYAIVDGWHSERSAPSRAEIASIPPLPRFPNPQAPDEAALDRFQAEVAAIRALPASRHFAAYIDWHLGPGECVSEGRHRLIQSGMVLAGVTVLAVAVLGASRIRRRHSHNENGRPEGRPFVLPRS